jgi:hypothetical protein
LEAVAVRLWADIAQKLTTAVRTVATAVRTVAGTGSMSVFERITREKRHRCAHTSVRSLVPSSMPYADVHEEVHVRRAPRRCADTHGRWRIDTVLPWSVLVQIAQRSGTLHAYTLYTGFLPERIRGEMRSAQVLGAR